MSGRSRATRRPRPRRSGSCSPSAPRLPGSRLWCSTVAATPTTAASPRSPTPPARRGWSSDRCEVCCEWKESLMPGRTRQFGGGQGGSGGQGGNDRGDRRDRRDRRDSGRRGAGREKSPHPEKGVTINRLAKGSKGRRPYSSTPRVGVGG